jgi:isopropylmalate/homocitrate/citramalate synthase
LERLKVDVIEAGFAASSNGRAGHCQRHQRRHCLLTVTRQ